MAKVAEIGGKEQNSPEIASWLKLIRADGVGPTIFGRLLKKFSTPKRALEASVSELAKVEGIGFKTAEKIVRSRGDFDAEKELALAEKLGVWLVNMEDDRYPPGLKAIYDPPPVLYVKGTLERSDSLSIAIVGSRRCSSYGSEQASRFGHILASAGFTIVSGMARGIDTAAHRGALSAKGRTIAVQGCGLSNIFPPENDKIFEMIGESGACVSELPLTYEPLSENFPGRNRIIAGLSLGVIVIEASARSGALITAKSALEHGREVMAIPGKIDSPVSFGSHNLIKQGARLVDCIEDVMEAMGCVGQGLKGHATAAAAKATEKAETPLFDVGRLNLTDAERKVFDCLDGEPTHVEQIIAETSLGAGPVNSSLISLRLKGLIRQLPGSVFCKR